MFSSTTEISTNEFSEFDNLFSIEYRDTGIFVTPNNNLNPWNSLEVIYDGPHLTFILKTEKDSYAPESILEGTVKIEIKLFNDDDEFVPEGLDYKVNDFIKSVLEAFRAERDVVDDKTMKDSSLAKVLLEQENHRIVFDSINLEDTSFYGTRLTNPTFNYCNLADTFIIAEGDCIFQNCYARLEDENEEPNADIIFCNNSNVIITGYFLGGMPETTVFYAHEDDEIEIQIKANTSFHGDLSVLPDNELIIFENPNTCNLASMRVRKSQLYSDDCTFFEDETPNNYDFHSGDFMLNLHSELLGLTRSEFFPNFALSNYDQDHYEFDGYISFEGQEIKRVVLKITEEDDKLETKFEIFNCDANLNEIGDTNTGEASLSLDQLKDLLALLSGLEDRIGDEKNILLPNDFDNGVDVLIGIGGTVVPSNSIIDIDSPAKELKSKVATLDPVINTTAIKIINKTNDSLAKILEILGSNNENKDENDKGADAESKDASTKLNLKDVREVEYFGGSLLKFSGDRDVNQRIKDIRKENPEINYYKHFMDLPGNIKLYKFGTNQAKPISSLEEVNDSMVGVEKFGQKYLKISKAEAEASSFIKIIQEMTIKNPDIDFTYLWESEQYFLFSIESIPVSSLSLSISDLNDVSPKSDISYINKSAIKIVPKNKVPIAQIVDESNTGDSYIFEVGRKTSFYENTAPADETEISMGEVNFEKINSKIMFSPVGNSIIKMDIGTAVAYGGFYKSHKQFDKNNSSKVRMNRYYADDSFHLYVVDNTEKTETHIEQSDLQDKYKASVQIISDNIIEFNSSATNTAYNIMVQFLADNPDVRISDIVKFGAGNKINLEVDTNYTTLSK
jgi:hypothetical protein